MVGGGGHKTGSGVGVFFGPPWRTTREAKRLGRQRQEGRRRDPVSNARINYMSICTSESFTCARHLVALHTLSNHQTLVNIETQREIGLVTCWTTTVCVWTTNTPRYMCNRGNAGYLRPLLVEVFVFERTPGLLRPQKHHHTPKQTDGSFSTSRYPPQEHLSDDHHRRRPRPRRKNEKTQLTIPSRPDPPTPPTGGRRRRRPQLLRRPPALRAAARTAVTSPGLDGEGCGPALRRTPRLPRRAAPTPQDKTKQNKTKYAKMDAQQFPPQNISVRKGCTA